MNEESHKFPREILNQIVENSGGGMVMFIVNDDGGIDTYYHYDHEMGQKALLKKVEDWALAQSELSNMDELGAYMLEDDNDDEDDEDE